MLMVGLLDADEPSVWPQEKVCHPYCWAPMAQGWPGHFEHWLFRDELPQ